jgi:hypothetical protein
VFFLFAQLKPQLEREEEVYTADGYIEQGSWKGLKTEVYERLGGVLSHPSRKNKNAARMGHRDPTLSKEMLRAYSPITRSRAGM